MLSKIYYNIEGEKIDLSRLSLDELEELNLKEEIYFSDKIKKIKPFSEERSKYLKEAYKKIFQISDWKKLKDVEEEYYDNKGNGVKKTNICLLKKIIRRQSKEKLIFYEAGVGKGYALEKLKDENIIIKGCDVFLSKKAKKIQKNNKNIQLEEKELFNALDNIKDETIDIFYADNVLEHLLEDEYEETCKKICNKIKIGGIAIFIIPNLYVGPHDISKKVLPMGSKPIGFHFMERTFEENIKIFLKYNMVPFFTWRNMKEQIKYGKDYLNMNDIKIKLEKYLGKIKSVKIRRKIFKLLGYNVYILKKEK